MNKDIPQKNMLYKESQQKNKLRIIKPNSIIKELLLSKWNYN